MARRLLAIMVALSMSTLSFFTATADHADEYPYEDTWDYSQYDCEGDPWNPIDPATGTRDPIGDPEPGTPEWAARSDNQTACTDQRQTDNRHQPIPRYLSSARYGEDPYRWPERHDNVRFRFAHFNRLDIPSVPSAELYLPCPTDPTICPGLPEGLQRFDPPYPVVVVMHGVIAQDSHHRFNTQVFAENGYMAIGVDGTGAGYTWLGSGPNVQRCANAGEVIEWLASSESGAYGQQADLSRVAFAGHSQGSGCALGYQGDPRVHAILAWDGGDSISDDNCTADPETGELRPCAPIMYQRTDGGFSSPTSHSSGYPSTRDRGLATYTAHKQRGMDVFHFTARSTEHVDWNGRGTQLNGNRLFEDFSNYYNVAWLDRHLKGKLVLDADGNVVTSGGRDETQERAYRQAQAEAAYQRLIATKFSGMNVHNISMGFWSPAKAEASGDTLFGGNVPYHIDGKWTLDRFSWFYRSYCSVSVPNYLYPDGGLPGAPHLVARADSGGASGAGPADDVRIHGCPEQERFLP